MREGLIRAFWLALVVAAFALPLFVGLGRTDVESDEGIYSYAVDQMLEQGDWMNPRSSPHRDEVFLEKPPLKFWIVATPLALGLLPHNEFGMRFMDAVFGGVSFLYVLAFGRRLGGWLCGFLAVAVLFLFPPLVFSHGLRGNNMEAPLLLCYCGGMYHWLAWARASNDRRRRGHALAVALYFYLGFMTKFVAAVFLPMIVGVAAILFRDTRARLVREWRTWAFAAAVVLLLAAPWFIYQQVTVGSDLWRVILGEHVYTRFTDSLDVAHLQPWHFYFVEIWNEMVLAHTAWLTAAGVLVLLARLLRERWLEGVLVLLWFALPMGLISLGTSKLIHYAYPFLPPLALAAGYGPAWLIQVLSPRVRQALDRLLRRAAGVLPGPRIARALLVIGGTAVAISLVTLVFGPLRWRAGDVIIFRNSDVMRPLMLAAALGLVANRPRFAVHVLALMLMILILPIDSYWRTFARLDDRNHPLRTARDCLSAVQAKQVEAGRPVARLYAVGEQNWFLHSYYYYLRHLGWHRAAALDDESLAGALGSTGDPRPILVTDADYRGFRMRNPSAPEGVAVLTLQHVLLLMPGPYATCAPEVLQAQRRRR